MKKILESLRKLLPQESLTEVSSAVEEMMNEARAELNSEFNEKLEEAYSTLAAEKEQAEKIALQGYQEAYAFITDLRNRMEIMKEEYEKELLQGYQEAYDMIQDEKSKTNSSSNEIYEEYDSKLHSMNEFYIDKIDQFLAQKGKEIYEQAKRDILNDPRMAEHKVAMDKIVEVASKYMSDEDMVFATGSKLEEAAKQVEELRSQVRMMEARNIKLSHDNTKLNEHVRKVAANLNESRNIERKERSKNAKNASGKGHTVLSEDMVVIAEHNANRKGREVDTSGSRLVESLNMDKKTLNLLAGTKKGKI